VIKIPLTFFLYKLPDEIGYMTHVSLHAGNEMAEMFCGKEGRTPVMSGKKRDEPPPIVDGKWVRALMSAQAWRSEHNRAAAIVLAVSSTFALVTLEASLPHTLKYVTAFFQEQAIN
jgi:hypothetical protein